MQIGLSDKEAVVYEALLGGKENSIAQLLHKVPEIKRANLYALLYALKEKGLVQEVEKKGKKVFTPESPQKLVEFTEKREKEYKESKLNLESALPSLLSQFNLASGKPNVQFYEGAKGMEKVFFDSLRTTGEILTYVDSTIVHELFAEINAKYVKERYRLGIKKKIIGPESPTLHETAKNANKELTQVRALPKEFGPFPTVMQIYDDYISYQTIENDVLVGIIIQDRRISTLSRQLFMFNWERATILTEDALENKIG